jgi:glutathione S-transferase
LYYAELLNPRKACVVARHLRLPVEFVRVDLARGEHKSGPFLAMNPNGLVPVLRDGDLMLWESNAIMCHLSDVAGSDLWPHDSRQVEVLRWLFWDAQRFTRHTGNLYFEHVIKPAIGMGAPDAASVAEATTGARAMAELLDAHLQDRDFLVGEAFSVADIAVGAALPWAAGARLPLEGLNGIARWHARLADLPAWQEPFPRT